eukprot:UN11457
MDNINQKEQKNRRYHINLTSYGLDILQLIIDNELMTIDDNLKIKVQLYSNSSFPNTNRNLNNKKRGAK